VNELGHAGWTVWGKFFRPVPGAFGVLDPTTFSARAPHMLPAIVRVANTDGGPNMAKRIDYFNGLDCLAEAEEAKREMELQFPEREFFVTIRRSVGIAYLHEVEPDNPNAKSFHETAVQLGYEIFEEDGRWRWKTARFTGPDFDCRERAAHAAIKIDYDPMVDVHPDA